ncbi:unnamed protein product [Penicillium salamii]|uniref:VWFA domain-containing protein n=1 Tax=Penicillium salamii TaxID=1612424 RepID=A0A9W4K3Q3_9EURO|nr:unnamed protein product [Penicillium salamii]
MNRSISGSTGSPTHPQSPSHTIGINYSPTEPPSYTLAVRSPPTSAGSQVSSRQSFATTSSGSSYRSHETPLVKAAHVRAQDEMEVQKMLHSVQMSCRIYNPEIEPEHETHVLCDCPVHQYWKRKFERLEVLEMWSKAVLYPGEKPYHDFSHLRLSNNNPYANILSSYTLASSSLRGIAKPDPQFHIRFVQQMIALDLSLNEKAEAVVQSAEPSVNIWELERLESLVSDMSHTRRQSAIGELSGERSIKRSTFRKAFSVRSSDERTALKIKKRLSGSFKLRSEIIEEEQHRWPDEADKDFVSCYQERVGISRSVEELRTHSPIQYLHLLQAGYFEPIPVAWEGPMSNPLRFTIDSSAGWRGLTPAWRGYKNTAEERLYWTLRHRPGGESTTKLDLISELDMARERMVSTVQPHPRYHDHEDICRIQYPSETYSKQMKPPSRGNPDRKSPADNTIIMLDVCGSMDSNPLKPKYNQYLIAAFFKSNQPKHQELTKALLRRFVAALSKHDNSTHGYQLVTFSDQAQYVEMVNRWNLDEVWSRIHFGGRSRVMLGWQNIKELHFQKHSETVTYHPMYGWQAGPQTPRLRLVLMLAGEIADMDEFELTLLDASWAYITIFLIGVDDCPRHHRRAGRLRRMADLNSRVSFIEAQGLVSERFVTHELLKCHLGENISMSEFEDLEQQPVELPSPLGPRAQRAQPGQSRSEQLPVELHSTDEESAWRRRSGLPHTPGLYELPDDQRPVELPATEILTLTQRPAIPTRPPPLPPQPTPDYLLDPPPPYLEAE